MNTRIAATIMLVTFWVLWAPLALASHTAAGSRPMCAVDSSEAHDADSHQSGHDANSMDGTTGKLCSVGVCATFLSSSGTSVQFRHSYESYVQSPPQNLVMTLPQIPDPVPKSLLLSA